MSPHLCESTAVSVPGHLPNTEPCVPPTASKTLGTKGAQQSKQGPSFRYSEAIIGISNTFLWPGDRVRPFAEGHKRTKMFPVSSMTGLLDIDE